jgi:hypothetical protein
MLLAKVRIIQRLGNASETMQRLSKAVQVNESYYGIDLLQSLAGHLRKHRERE